jgi:transposase-like protein
MDAAKEFFKQALAVVGHTPEHVTTDGHPSYPRAIREIMGSAILHRKNKYLNNGLEQDRCGIKQRYYPMRGFKPFEAAARFCCAFDDRQPEASRWQQWPPRKNLFLYNRYSTSQKDVRVRPQWLHREVQHGPQILHH